MTHPGLDVEMEGTRLVKLRYRGRWMRVLKIVDAWVDQSRWWSAEERRDCARVIVDGGGSSPALTLDIYRRDDVWHLVRVHD
ncbi:MAG: hypothetical protein AAFQ53_00110 [Bacteroidota bacterium]